MAKTLTVQSVERFKPDPNKRLEVPDGLLPGLYFVLQPSGVRSWAVRYRHRGKPRKLTLGPYPVLDLGTARARGREALQVVALGRDPASEKQETLKAARLAEPGADTIASIVATFLDRHARAKTKANTADDTERLFRLHVLPQWGERCIQDITRRDVIALLDGIVDKGTPITANRTLGAVSKLFNWSLDRAIIETSPCIRITRPSQEKSRDRVLTDDELRLIWKAASRKGWPFGQLIQTLMLTAQRRTEVGDVRWGELKDGGLWTISGSRTKNGAEHDVPLSEPAQAILASAARIAGSEFVFTTTGVRPISGYSQAKERLDALMLQIAREEATEACQEASAVTLAPWRIHDLRRSAASGMARMGFAVHVIEAVLNHRSGQISGVAAVYNRHSYLPEKRRALEAWATHVLGLVSGPAASNVVT
jgi:integrase